MAAWPPRGFTPKEFRTPRPELERRTPIRHVQSLPAARRFRPAFASILRPASEDRRKLPSSHCFQLRQSFAGQVAETSRRQGSALRLSRQHPRSNGRPFRFRFSSRRAVAPSQRVGTRLSAFGFFSCPLYCYPSESSPTARIFQTTTAGLRSAGFQTCCVADFQVGRINGSRTGSGFGNQRHSRLGSPRYFGCGCAALCSLRLNLPPLSVPPGNPPIRRSALHPQTLRRHFRAP